jgi:MFS family permease
MAGGGSTNPARIGQRTQLHAGPDAETPVFWLIFIMMSMMSTGGLVVITQFTSFAKSFGIDAKTTVVIGMTLAAIPTALTFDRITNGLTRPFFGWVSDHIGRENTMGIAFILEGIAIYLCCSIAPTLSC